MELIGAAADVAGWFLMGVATVVAAEALRKLAGFLRDEEVEALRRRIADLEALRRCSLRDCEERLSIATASARPDPDGIISKHLGDRP